MDQDQLGCDGVDWLVTCAPHGSVGLLLDEFDLAVRDAYNQEMKELKKEAFRDREDVKKRRALKNRSNVNECGRVKGRRRRASKELKKRRTEKAIQREWVLGRC